MSSPEEKGRAAALASRIRAGVAEHLLKGFRWVFVLIFAAGIVLNLSAVWSVRWLPMGDLGGWIELMDVMARHDDPATVYGETYRLPARPDPNVLALAFGWLAGPFMRAHTAASVLVSLYVVALPLSLLAMCLAFGRSKWLALFSVPMVFNTPFLVGLLNYIIALPLVFFAIALARSYAENGRLPRGIALACVLVLLYFAHVLAFLMGWSMCLAVVLLSSDARRYHLRLWPVLPALLFFAAWYWRKFIALEATESGVTFGTGAGFQFVHPVLDGYFARIHVWGMRMFRDGTEEVFVIVLLLVWLMMISLSQARRRGADKGSFPRRFALELVTLCCIVAYFCLPTAMNQLGLISERVVILFLLLLTAWPRLKFDRWAGRAVLVPLAAAAIAYPFFVKDKFEAFEEEYVGGLPGAIASLPDGTRLAYVMWNRENPLTHMGTLWHIPQAINAVENGGTTDKGFARLPYCAVQFRRGREPKSLPSRFWESPHVRDYDYVLLLASKRPKVPLGRSDLRLAFHENWWWLFEVLDAPDAVGRAR